MIQKCRLRLQGHANSGLAQQVKSYRAGFSERIYERLKETRRQFFSEQSSSSNSLVCIDDETRKDEAEAYFMKLNPNAKDRVSRVEYSWSGFDQGRDDAEDLPLNNAVNQQNEILGVKHA